MVITARNIISIAAGAFAMACLSYLWHGVFLEDFSRPNFNFNSYLTFAPAGFLLISFFLFTMVNLDLMNFVFRSFDFDSLFKRYFINGFMTGALCGAIVYVVLYLLGLTFSKGTNTLNILFDLFYQMAEEGIGGLLIKWLCSTDEKKRRTHLNHR